MFYRLMLWLNLIQVPLSERRVKARDAMRKIQK